jgi:hypothetical protein
MENAHHGADHNLAQVEELGSVGEKQIARMLDRYKVRFLYEYPVAVVDRGKVRVWYPDFWLPDYGVAIEYAGVTGSEDYSSGVAHKKEVFENAGISCVYVDPEGLNGGWPKRVLAQVRGILADRLIEFDSLETRLASGQKVKSRE